MQFENHNRIADATILFPLKNLSTLIKEIWRIKEEVKE